MLGRLGAAGNTLVLDVNPADTFARALRNLRRRCACPAGACGRGRGARPVRRGHQGGRRAAAGVLDHELLTDVIRRPLITEKTSILREDGKTIVLTWRGCQQDRHQACGRAAVRAKVASVRTSLAHGKVKRQDDCRRRSDGRRAYVRLRDGEKLPEF